ncbi:hypothetical protein D7X12_17940 [Corallococcus sicarius]|uniref:DUF6484 domain-containing protein n=1 Tax=Corallococcus sicarius TaxID=2316726 RepID=A0A3A8NNJ3_9BACT|nr:hypothetical protein D7X12_17940 [Corallococcus sicarius]
MSPDGLALVDFEGNPSPGPVTARSFVTLEPAQLRVAIEERRDAALLFEEGDPTRPLLVALAQRAGAPSLLEQLLDDASRPGGAERPADALSTPSEAKDSNQEERRVLGAQRELVLQVGEASIILRRDGTILLRGVRVESRASGLQLIRGGKIELN